MFQEVICSPEDILGYHPERERDGSIYPLARTVCELLSHATPRSPKDNQSDPFFYDQSQADDEEYYRRDIAENTIEVKYQRNLGGRYIDDRIVSNFNTFSEYPNSQHYTIDEAEEYYDNNNTDLAQNPHHSPVYTSNDGIRNRGPYYHKNRIQFVTPFCKGDGILKSGVFEIYDTDEVDFPIQLQEEPDTERYDRGKMNLDIQNNLNRDLTMETDAEKKDRLLFTCLCLGTFIVSAFILFLYPL